MNLAAAGLLLMLAPSAWALDFASSQRPAILYDSPSTAAGKIAVVSAGYPLEKLVTAAGWIKVRDETGKLAWVEEAGQRLERGALLLLDYGFPAREFYHPQATPPARTTSGA